VPVAFAHFLTAGNDLGIWWVALMVWGSAAAVATAVLARLIAAIRPAPGPAGLRQGMTGSPRGNRPAGNADQQPVRREVARGLGIQISPRPGTASAHKIDHL
jgi:hypothetical protein